MRLMFALPRRWTYLYRAVDSAGDTIDFLLSSNRDAQAAKRFFQRALRSLNHPRPRVINVDGNPSYPKVITELRRTGELGRRCRCRPIRYWNNIVEQDHRAIKRRVRASQGFRSFESAWRTIPGIETMHMIRKGQVRWLPKDDILEHACSLRLSLECPWRRDEETSTFVCSLSHFAILPMEECYGQSRMQLIQQAVSSDFATPSSDCAFISRMPGRAQSQLCGSPRR